MPYSKSHTINLGWDQPLDVDWDFQLDSLRQEIKRTAPGKSGALVQAFNDPDTVVIDETHNVITIAIGPNSPAYVYAGIQEYGGYIPAFDIRRAQRKYIRRSGIRNRLAGAGLTGEALRFRTGRAYGPVMRAWIGGAVRFFSKRRGFFIHGQNYVQQGVFNWWNRLMRGTAGPARWRSKHYATPMGQARGTVSR